MPSARQSRTRVKSHVGVNKTPSFWCTSEPLLFLSVLQSFNSEGRVDSLQVRDDTEIDWKTLADPDWNLWSAHTLQRRWLTMKRSIKGYENMSHAGKHFPLLRVPLNSNAPSETMDILRVKKAHLPLPPSQSTKKRKERKVTSAAAIPDADVMNSADTTRAGSENTAATGGSQPDSESESDSDSSSSVSSSGSE